MFYTRVTELTKSIYGILNYLHKNKKYVTISKQNQM